MILVAWPLSAYPSLSTRFLLYYVTCMLCVVVIVSTVETWRHLTRLMAFSSLALLVMSLAGLYQRIQGVEVNPSYVDMNLNKGMPGRVWSFYENPNTFAEVLLLLIPVAIAYMLCSKGWLGRFLGFFSAAVGCVAMAMTYSRASWVGLRSRRWSLWCCGTGSSSPSGFWRPWWFWPFCRIRYSTEFSQYLIPLTPPPTAASPCIRRRGSSCSSAPSWAPAWALTRCGRPSEI